REVHLAFEAALHHDELRGVDRVVALHDSRKRSAEIAEPRPETDIVRAGRVDGARGRARIDRGDQRRRAQRRAKVGGADQLGRRLAMLELALGRELHILGHLVQSGASRTSGRWCRGPTYDGNADDAERSVRALAHSGASVCETHSLAECKLRPAAAGTRVAANALASDESKGNHGNIGLGSLFTDGIISRWWGSAGPRSRDRDRA